MEEETLRKVNNVLGPVASGVAGGVLGYLDGFLATIGSGIESPYNAPYLSIFSNVSIAGDLKNERNKRARDNLSGYVVGNLIGLYCHYAPSIEEFLQNHQLYLEKLL